MPSEAQLNPVIRDPHEIRNLINSRKHRPKLNELRQALDGELAERATSARRPKPN